MQNFVTLFHSVQETGPFSHYQNLDLSTASTVDKCHFANLVYLNVSSKFYQNNRNGLRVMSIFGKQSGDKIFANNPGTDTVITMTHSESQPSDSLSVDFLRVVPLKS